MTPLITHLLAAGLATTGSPIGTPWVLYQEARIQTYGQPLPTPVARWAEDSGVENVDSIRVLHADVVPLPAPMFIRRALGRLGYPTASVGGLCLRHGIYLQTGIPLDSETLRHELIHTRQYQEAGSVTAFLISYLYQSLTAGYYDAPLEEEARAGALR